MLVSTTSEVIKKLQEYEAKYGTGVIRSIGTYCAGDRENNYYITIANDSFWNEKLNNEAIITVKELLYLPLMMTKFFQESEDRL